MSSTTPVDTIVAVATAAGRAGIGVVRLSGPDALQIAGSFLTCPQLDPRHATFTHIVHGTTRLDQAVVTWFPAPQSYTGEDVVEISAHGSPVVLRAVVDLALAGGARRAERGEFTLRAYVNGRMDLTQAEAVADLVDATTMRQVRAAFDQLEGTVTRAIAAIGGAVFDLIARLEASIDFPEEGYHFIDRAALVTALEGAMAQCEGLLAGGKTGRLIREGLRVVVLGRPNVGKSSVFNRLVGTERVIVDARPGTTRDMVTEVVELDGFRMTLVDTAGLREAADAVEADGVERARLAGASASMRLLVFDPSVPWSDEDERVLEWETDSGNRGAGAEFGRVVVLNKRDLPCVWPDSTVERLRPLGELVAVSALQGDGFEQLRARIAMCAGAGASAEPPVITNDRHLELVRRARVALGRAREAVGASEGDALPEEFVLADLQEARAAFEEVTGATGAEDVLAHIFSRFCIGK